LRNFVAIILAAQLDGELGCFRKREAASGVVFAIDAPIVHLVGFGRAAHLLGSNLLQLTLQV
jgi:hypothetical protein